MEDNKLCRNCKYHSSYKDDYFSKTKYYTSLPSIYYYCHALPNVIRLGWKNTKTLVYDIGFTNKLLERYHLEDVLEKDYQWERDSCSLYEPRDK